MFVCSPIARKLEGKAIKWPRKQFEGSREPRCHISTRDSPSSHHWPNLQGLYESQLLFASPLKSIGRIHRSFLLGAENVCSTSGLFFFKDVQTLPSSSILKSQDPPKKEAKHLLMLRCPKPAPTPTKPTNQQNPPFFGFHKIGLNENHLSFPRSMEQRILSIQVKQRLKPWTFT